VLAQSVPLSLSLLQGGDVGMCLCHLHFVFKPYCEGPFDVVGALLPNITGAAYNTAQNIPAVLRHTG